MQDNSFRAFSPLFPHFVVFPQSPKLSRLTLIWMPGIGDRGGTKQWLFSDTESAQAQNNGQQVIKVCPQSAGSIVAPTCNVRREEETMVYAGLAATTRLSLMGLSALTTVPSVMLHFPSEPPSRFRLHRKCTWDHVRATKSPVRHSKAIFFEARRSR